MFKSCICTVLICFSYDNFAYCFLVRNCQFLQGTLPKQIGQVVSPECITFCACENELASRLAAAAGKNGISYICRGRVLLRSEGIKVQTEVHYS